MNTSATPATFAVTWDYRCPFARNAHEHVVTALEAGAPWDVTFVPFSLRQMHVDEGRPSVWDDPTQDTGLLALQAGVAVRDHAPDRFLAVHRALFAARHDDALDFREEAVVRDVLAAQGVDPTEVFDHITSGETLATIRKEHEWAESAHQVWGVPTFIAGDRGVFVRLMHRPDGDGALARRTIERVFDLVAGFPELNEFKQTHVPR